MHPAHILLRRDLCLPLEGREGLGHKEGRGEVDGKPPLFVGSVLLPDLKDLPHQIRNSDDVLVGLRGKPQHEVELHVVPAAGESRGAGGEHLLLGDILVDGVPEALAARLRSKGEAALAYPLHLGHELSGEIIRTKGGQGEVDVAALAIGKQAVGQRRELTVIGGREA